MSRVYNEYYFSLPDLQPPKHDPVMYISRHPAFRYYSNRFNSDRDYGEQGRRDQDHSGKNYSDRFCDSQKVQDDSGSESIASTVISIFDYKRRRQRGSDYEILQIQSENR